MGYTGCQQQKLAKALKVGTDITGLQYTTEVTDNPLHQTVANVLLESDMRFMNLQEEVSEEPEFVLSASDAELIKPASGTVPDFTKNIQCRDCTSEIYDEYLFSKYCVAAVRRYMSENQLNASLKNAYVTFIAHYNRALDVQSFEENEGNLLRESRITRAPLCMKEGNLLYAIHWMKWKMGTLPLKEFYDNESRKKKRKARLKYHKKVALGEIKPAKRR